MNVLALFFCSESGNLAKWFMRHAVLKPLPEKGSLRGHASRP